jgi:hypothetical protein
MPQLSFAVRAQIVPHIQNVPMILGRFFSMTSREKYRLFPANSGTGFQLVPISNPTETRTTLLAPRASALRSSRSQRRR